MKHRFLAWRLWMVVFLSASQTRAWAAASQKTSTQQRITKEHHRIQRLSKDYLRKCRFEVLLVDDRPWKRVGVNNMPYWVMSGVLNYAYSTHFGYDFRLVKPGPRKGGTLQGDLYPGWHKVQYLKDRMDAYDDERRHLGDHAAPCTWILYMDSDAFVREYDLQLPSFLADLSSRYFIREDVGIIFTREANLTGQPLAEAPKAAFLNTGVLLLQLNEATRRLVDAWLATGYATTRMRLRNTWPGEQGLLSEYLLPGCFLQGKTVVNRPRDLRRLFAVVNLTEFNSPWGRFVQHSYGKAANAQVSREQSFRDALLRLDCLRLDCLAPIRRKLMSLITDWAPAPLF